MPSSDDNRLILVRAYVAHTWSSLDEAGRNRIRKVISAAKDALQEAEMDIFLASEAYPPGSRTGQEARSLWIALRREMANCHLALAIYSGPSEGVAIEARNAADFAIPAILLVEQGVTVGEMLRSPSLTSLAEIRFRSPGDARRKLLQFLRANAEEIQRIAFGLHVSRQVGERTTVVGRSIRYAREELGMTRQELAKKVGLSIEVIAAIEDDAFRFNTSHHHLALIARALGMDLPALCQPPEQWAYHYLDREVTKAASEWGWSVNLLEEFRQSRSADLGARERRPPDPEEIRGEMTRWLQYRNR
jgi:transcriptional regulator with XRE-family HTH domain